MVGGEWVGEGGRVVRGGYRPPVERVGQFSVAANLPYDTCLCASVYVRALANVQ